MEDIDEKNSKLCDKSQWDTKEDENESRGELKKGSRGCITKEVNSRGIRYNKKETM